MQKPGFNENRIFSNEKKHSIAINMLERYTGSPIKDFQKQVLLTNFEYYMQQFQKITNCPAATHGSAMSVIHSKKHGVSLINFNIGAPTCALIIELLATIHPKAVLLLGMCGGLHRSLKVGDFILPMAAIRGEGVTSHFLPPEVPSLPTFKVQKFVSQILVDQGIDYRTGVIHTTDYRFWEFSSKFKERLYSQRAIGIEMETAALFTAGFASKVANGALLLVSDLPLRRGGIKTKSSAKKVFAEFTDIHLEIGIRAMSEIADKGEVIRHYKW
ncbi:MAG: AMP nucleosidase [Oligoflexia bacterium]|nr:AMP nucleosidase [Oligoflexia bacterium]